MKRITSTILTAFIFTVTTFALLIFGGRRPAAAQSTAEFHGLPPLELCDSAGPMGTPYAVGFNCRTIEIEGYPRTYIVYVPDSARPDAPVVFLFHGTNGDGDGYLRNSGWLPKAQAEGIVLVSASGLRYCPEKEPAVDCPRDDLTAWETKWHTYQLAAEYDLDERMPDYPDGATWPPDDVGFITQVMDDVSAMGNGRAVDDSHFFASGFSAGAGFTARLARELPHRLKAVAYSSGGILDTSVYTGSPEINIPVLALLGTVEPGILKMTYGEDLSNAAPLPLDPVEFLELDNLIGSFVIPHLEGFDHNYSPANLMPVEIIEGSGHTLYRWRTGITDHIFQMGVLEGLMHTPPNGCDPQKNPLGWNGPDIYWEFFTSASDYGLTAVRTNSCPPS